MNYSVKISTSSFEYLYGPDYETVHTMSQLITNEMAQISNEIRYNHKKIYVGWKKQKTTAKIWAELLMYFKVLNLNEAAKELTELEELWVNQIHKLINSIQQLINGALASMNSIGILERNYTSSRLQFDVRTICKFL